MDACADELNALDGQLGDGDLGITMTRGMQAIRAEAASLPEDVGVALLRCAQAFTRTSGSSYGTLLATALMAAAKATHGRALVPWAEIPALLAAARDAMMARGKGRLGDKTVLDAIDAAATATAGFDQPAALVQAADNAVSAALDTFRGRQAQLGRARIFGEKSIGLDDPGMLAFKRVVEALRPPPATAEGTPTER
jgi:dihydroxyacetone kinase-like protein